ncbi:MULTISPECIES: ISAs1 family transposase [Paraburkholderia]|uniref:ISAs1 family transposase n=1 Tax=Paraburkholderia TaxID=1822464 RepID=UPI001CA46497|nr:ISAs1 family transposase [Paraburkholderia podalyriae]
MHTLISIDGKSVRGSGWAHMEPSIFETLDKGHGRIETRHCVAVSAPDYMSELNRWPRLKSLVRIERTRDIGGQVSVQTQYLISSAAPDARHLLEASRMHWAIANGLHHCLDVTFREDASTVRLRNALTVLWEAADRICGKRLKALIPKLVDAMERHGHLDLDPVVKAKLLQVSAATIERMLANARAHIDGQRKRRTGVGSAIRRSIPVRTFADWRDPPPGFFEIDMVEKHCGGSKIDGEFVHTLTLTDIASGWTECVAMRVRNQRLVIEGFEKAAADLPFAMLGVDSDHDSAFMNQSVLDYCKGRGLVQTRSRAYKKNDQAWVEQKNGAVVRRLVGYGRLSGVSMPGTRWRSCTRHRGYTLTSSSLRSS